MMSKPSMTSWADAATMSREDTRLDIAVIGERSDPYGRTGPKNLCISKLMQ